MKLFELIKKYDLTEEQVVSVLEKYCSDQTSKQVSTTRVQNKDELRSHVIKNIIQLYSEMCCGISQDELEPVIKINTDLIDKLVAEGFNVYVSTSAWTGLYSNLVKREDKSAALYEHSYNCERTELDRTPNQCILEDLFNLAVRNVKNKDKDVIVIYLVYVNYPFNSESSAYISSTVLNLDKDV